MNKVIEPALEGYPTGFAAPTYKVLSENWREVNHLVAPIIKRRDAQERRLELLTDGIIDFWSLDNPDMIRGRRYKRFVINEAGYISDLMDIWNFIIRSTLVDLEGDAIIGGTPKGRNGFWQMYQYGLDPKMPEWVCWQISSYENPYVPKAELDEMVNTLPERVVDQEIYAKFIDDAGGVFRRVMEATTAQEQIEPDPEHQYIAGVDITAQEQIEPDPEHQYIAGVDIASLVDFTVVIVMDVTTGEMAFMDRFNRVDYSVLEDRLEAIYNRFNLDTMTIEDNSIGKGVIDHLRNRGLTLNTFTTTNSTKHAAVTALQSAFEHGRIKIINDPVLVGELQAFEAKRNNSGTFSYSAPEGLHDDCVMALAIAWQGLEGGKWDAYVY
jgi:phage terminase large subunit-like protein